MKTSIIQVKLLEKSILSLKEETNETTASKALIKAAQNYQSNLDMIATRDIEIDELKKECRRLRSLLLNHVNSMTDINDYFLEDS